MALLTDRTALVTPADGDFYVTTDISDLSDAATGTDKKITYANLKAAILTSPTVTGTLTVPVGLTGVLRADTGVVSVDGDVTDIVAAGTEGAAGKLELATDAETVTGSDTARATTPANITAKMAAPGAIGGTTPAAGTFTTVTTTGNIELGHASATTLSGSAGVLSVEGTAVLTVAGGTLTGNLTLAENTSIALDPAGSADGKYSGITIAGTAGAALAFGDLCYLDPTDSRWELADANAAAAADGDARGVLGICVLAAAGDASATTMLLHGVVRADTAFPALTIGAPVYVSETAGDIVVTQPVTTDVVIRIVGVALTADEIFFNPDFTWTTHT